MESGANEMTVRDTSLEAYFGEILPTVGTRQKIVYDAIKHLGCPTNLELSKYLFIPINSIVPRVFEVRQKGLVTECEKRECSISHRTVWSWRIRND